jgi:hypothetical protein
MQVEEFREWLKARRNSTNSINSKIASVRKVEKELATLGSPQIDLDAAYDDDKFAQLRTVLNKMRGDYQAGGQWFRTLFPESDNPINRISNTLAWLGQYGQFRGNVSQDAPIELDPEEVYWLVGASFGNEDQVERFLREGIWEIKTPKDTEAAAVRSMRVGERIAIKATFVQKLNLPFDNRGQSVSVMRIKARGTVTENRGDGERVSVSWDEDFGPRDWYFYTYRATIWQVRPESELSERLIAFIFYDDLQDWNWFRNHTSWSAQFGDDAEPRTQRFWMEKTIVNGRADRESGEHSLGRALWSPQRSKDGKNIYANMLELRPGDVIFHLTNNEAISDVSVASEAADSNFTGIEGSDWGGQPGYRIALKDHQKLDPPLGRSAFLETEPFATELRELAESGARGLFYNSHRGLNQGAYLTEITPTLLSILNRAYEALCGLSLPYAPADGNENVEPTAEEVVTPYTLDDALQTLFLDRSAAEEILHIW